MSKHFAENKKDLAYFLNTYKLQGHTTWRAHLSGHEGGFKAEQKAWQAGPTGKIAREHQAAYRHAEYKSIS